MTLSEILAECIKLKEGNTELALTHCEGVWDIGIGNPSAAVSLGESNPEHFSGGYPTPELAAMVLLTELRRRSADAMREELKDRQRG